jgi:hypothetical protein
MRFPTPRRRLRGVWVISGGKGAGNATKACRSLQSRARGMSGIASARIPKGGGYAINGRTVAAGPACPASPGTPDLERQSGTQDWQSFRCSVRTSDNTMSNGNPISSARCLAAVRKIFNAHHTPKNHRGPHGGLLSWCGRRANPAPGPQTGSAGGGMGEVAGRIRHGSRDLMTFNPRVSVHMCNEINGIRCGPQLPTGH